MAAADSALIVDAALDVLDILAGIELECAILDTGGIGLEGLPGQAERIFGIVLAQSVGDQRQLAVGVRAERDLGEALVARRRAVLAVAVGVET